MVVTMSDYKTIRRYDRPCDNQSPQKGTGDNFERLLFLKLKLRSMLRSGRFNYVTALTEAVGI